LDLIDEIVKEDKQGEAFTKKSLTRYQKAKKEYNEELKRYYAIIDKPELDLEELNKVFKTMTRLIKEIGTCTNSELLKGFNEVLETKAITINIDNIEEAKNKIAEVRFNDIWETKKLDLYVKSNVSVVIFERPLFYSYANILEEQ